MVMNPALQWLLTFLFAVTGLYWVIRVFVGFSLVDRVNNFLHVTMGVVMLAMPWEWGMRIPTGLQMAIFGLAALWYAYFAFSRPDVDAGPLEAHHRGAVFLWYHAVMMGAMVWMAVRMPAVMGATGSGGPGAMDMSGSGAAGSWDMVLISTTEPWAAGVSTALAGLFVLASFAFLMLLFPRRPAPGRGGGWLLTDLLASVLMAAGMSISLGAMVWH